MQILALNVIIQILLATANLIEVYCALVTFCQFLQNTYYFDDFLVTEESLVHLEYHSAGDSRYCLKV